MRISAEAHRVLPEGCKACGPRTVAVQADCVVLLSDALTLTVIVWLDGSQPGLLESKEVEYTEANFCSAVSGLRSDRERRPAVLSVTDSTA